MATDDDLRFLDPWGKRWLTAVEMEAVLADRIALSQTWRYRIGRAWEQVRRRPVRASTYWLVRRHDAHMARYLNA